jgi:hypothetical protein
MKDVYYTPDELAQISFNLDGFTDNIKSDRTSEDLLFQVMLELGIPLSANIELHTATSGQTQGSSPTMWCVNDNYLIACFDRVDTGLITDIAKKKPYYAVFRDSSFLSDSAMVNFEQVFSTYSPGTIRRILEMDKNSLNFQIYKLDDENEINVLVRDDSIWTTQKAMGELFGVDRTSVTRHLKNVFESEELDENVVCAEIALTTQHGAIVNKTQTTTTKFYNLDAIISVGYRVNSLKATRFRQWATKILKEYMIKGFVMDDKRLKQGETIFGRDYFK